MTETEKTEMKFGLARVKPFYRGLVNGAVLVILYYEFIAPTCG